MISKPAGNLTVEWGCGMRGAEVMRWVLEKKEIGSVY
jgi:hypothetical protein